MGSDLAQTLPAENSKERHWAWQTEQQLAPALERQKDQNSWWRRWCPNRW